MEIIKTVDELKTLIKEKVLPAYEAAYADGNSDFDKLRMELGICNYCKHTLGKDVYRFFYKNSVGVYIAPTIWHNYATREQAILPRIKWMRKFINS